MEYEVIRDASFCNNQAMTDEIYNLIKPSYEDPTEIVEFNFKHCDTLYFVRDSESQIISFFFIAWETLVIEEGKRLLSFLG